MKKSKTHYRHSSYGFGLKSIALLTALFYGSFAVHPNYAFAALASSGNGILELGDESVQTPSNVVQSGGVQWYESVSVNNNHNQGRVEAATFASLHAVNQDWDSIFDDTELGDQVDSADSVITDVISNVDGSYQVVLTLTFKDLSGNALILALANYRINDKNNDKSIEYLSIAYRSEDDAVSGSITTEIADGSRIRAAKISENVQNGAEISGLNYKKVYDDQGALAAFTKKSTTTAALGGGSTRTSVVLSSQGEDGTVITTTTQTTKDSGGRVTGTTTSKERRDGSDELVEASEESFDYTYWDATSIVRTSVKEVTTQKAGGLVIAVSETIDRDVNGRLELVERLDQNTRTNGDGTKTVSSVEMSTEYTNNGRVRGDMVRTDSTVTLNDSNVKLVESVSTTNYSGGEIASKVHDQITYTAGVAAQRIAKTETYAAGAVSTVSTQYLNNGNRYQVNQNVSTGTVQVLDITGQTPVVVTGVNTGTATDPNAFMTYITTVTPYDAEGYHKTTGFHKDTGLDRDGYDVHENRKLFYPEPNEDVLKSHYVKADNTTTHFLVSGRKQRMVNGTTGAVTTYRDTVANTRYQVTETNGTVHTYNDAGTVKIKTVHPLLPGQRTKR